MITATEAAALYIQPPYTADEVESQIRERAKSADFTCFDAGRLGDALQKELIAQGFKVSRAGGDFLVSWEQK